MRKKQFWALLLALAMLCSLALPAYAEDGEGEAATVNDLTTNGFSIGDLNPLPDVTPPADAEVQATNFEITEKRFPDPAFRQYIIDNFGSSSLFSSTVRISNTDTVTAINCSGLGIADLRGVEFFTKLVSLDCSDNSLSELDLSANTALTSLNVLGNEMLVNALLYGERSQAGSLITLALEGYSSIIFPSGAALVGFHTVTFVYDDADGVSCSFSVIVPDGEPPVWPDSVDYPEREDAELLWYVGSADGEYYDWEAIYQDTTLYGKWSKYITVTLDYNGGTVNGHSEDEYPTIEGLTLEALDPATPTCSRKEFAGWLYQGQAYDPATPFPGEDITLVASWADAYAVHFDRSNPHDDNARVIDDITVVADGAATVSFSYQEYSTVLPPLLNDDQANGYQFIGWDTDPNAAIEEVRYPRWRADTYEAQNGPYEVRLDEENSYVTLYAIYGRIPTITVYKNDGTDTVSNNRVFGRGAFYSRLWIGGGNLTRSGFDLLGYSTDPNATEPDAGLEKPDPNQTPNVYYYTTKDVTLYAVWGAKRYTLSFNSNGGFGSLPNSVSFTMEDKPEIALPSAEELNLTKEHRVFLGWTLNNRYDDVNYGKNPTGTVYTAGSVLPASALKAANQTLYALWQYEPIVVSLDLNGYTGSYGEGASYPMYYNYGASKSVGNGAPTGRPRTPSAQPGPKPFPELPESVQISDDSNPFCCWMDVYAGDNDKVFYPLGIMANWNKGTSAILNNDRDTLLLAVWKYTFVYYYDADGAVTAADTITAAYISDNQCSYNTLTVRAAEEREGYDFLGWATEQGGEVVYRPGETIDTLSDLTLYPIYRSVYYVENPTLGEAVVAPQAAIDAGKTLFCGYYYDEKYTQPVEAGTAGVTGAYAKFVNPNVLTVKLQVRNASLTGDANKHDIRLITSIPGMDYISRVGFELVLPAFNNYTVASADFDWPLYKSIRSETNTVNVDSLFNVGGNTDSVEMALMTVKGFPHSYWTTTDARFYMTATPYYITKCGAKVYGTPRSFRCAVMEDGSLGFTDLAAND